MSIRTTVTLDEDVLERVKEESRARGASFRDTLNDLLRVALAGQSRPPFKRTLKIKPRKMGVFPGLNYDDVEALIEYAEGPDHR
jgi:hypothetical protein